MTHSVRHRYVDSGTSSYAGPLTFDAYDYDPQVAGGVEQPQLLLSARSATSRSRPTPGHRRCENASFTKRPSSGVLQRPTHASSSSGTDISSPPSDDISRQLNRTQRPTSASASSESSLASVLSPVKNQQIAREHGHRQHLQRNSILYNERLAATRMTSSPVPPVSKEGSASATQPPQAQWETDEHLQRVPTSRAPRSSVLTGTGPVIISTSYPPTGSLQALSSIQNLNSHTERGDRAENSAPPMNNIASRSTTMPSSLSSPPLHDRQAQVLIPTGQPSTPRPSFMAVAGSGRATAGSIAVCAPAPGKADVQPEADKELRSQRRQSKIREQGYVAQTAYTQRNPFRRQNFAEFAANPQYRPPPELDAYPQVTATRVYGLEVSRASQGDFMMRRLVDAAHPSTTEERAEMEVLFGATLEKLQTGDWFYKWTRINRVHQRYVWLNMQRGTLMWSPSRRKSVALNSEVKLSSVRSITLECLELDGPARVFYRMNISTQDSCVRLATEIRKKFDVWYRVLQQLTVPNWTYGVPDMWGRPSKSVNACEWGSKSRWASRYSPLAAITDHAPVAIGPHETYAPGAVSSSD